MTARTALFAVLLTTSAASAQDDVDALLQKAMQEAVQRVARKAAGRFVSDRTKRRPMIVPVVIEA